MATTLARKSGIWMSLPGIFLACDAVLVYFGAMPRLTADTPFGPSNPFHAPSTLPFQLLKYRGLEQSDSSK